MNLYAFFSTEIWNVETLFTIGFMSKTLAKFSNLFYRKLYFHFLSILFENICIVLTEIFSSNSVSPHKQIHNFSKWKCLVRNLTSFFGRCSHSTEENIWIDLLNMVMFDARFSEWSKCYPIEEKKSRWGAVAAFCEWCPELYFAGRGCYTLCAWMLFIFFFFISFRQFFAFTMGIFLTFFKWSIFHGESFIHLFYSGESLIFTKFPKNQILFYSFWIWNCYAWTKK